MSFPLVRSDSWSAFLTVGTDLFWFRSYTQQQVEFSKMGLNQRRLLSLCWEKFLGTNFNDEGKGRHICLFQVRTVIPVAVCGNTVCVHCFTGQCAGAVDLTFIIIRKTFPIYHWMALRLLGVTQMLIYLFILFHWRFLPQEASDWSFWLPLKAVKLSLLTSPKICNFMKLFLISNLSHLIL